MGRRVYPDQWLTVYILEGQIEIRYFRRGSADPYHGIVATADGDPITISAGSHYEILALADANLMLLIGNYASQVKADFGSLVQIHPDESP
jgi:hypothetical protein